MKFALLIFVCLVIAPIIVAAINGRAAPAAPAPHPLAIAQQVTAEHAAQRLAVEVEAANIEGALNRALADIGSRTQLHADLSFAKWMCFEQGKATPVEIKCARGQAGLHHGTEVMVFARMP